MPKGVRVAVQESWGFNDILKNAKKRGGEGVKIFQAEGTVGIKAYDDENQKDGEERSRSEKYFLRQKHTWCMLLKPFEMATLHLMRAKVNQLTAYILMLPKAISKYKLEQSKHECIPFYL